MGLTADQKKAAKRAAKAGGNPTVQTPAEATKPTNGKSKSSESATPAAEEKSEEPPAAKPSLLAQLDEALDETETAPTETPVAEIETEEVAPVAAEPETDNAPEAPAMRIGEDELVALIDERISLAIAPVQAEMATFQQSLQNALDEVNSLSSKLAEIDLANSEAIDQYATPATQAAFATLVNEFWVGEWKPTVGNLLSEILELKNKVEKDEGDRTILNRAKPALELLTQLPEVRKELKELVEAGKAIETRIAAKVAELKGGNAQTPTIQTPTSRFATSK